MSVQARLEAALDGERVEVDASGGRTKDVTIPNTGITDDDLEDHDAVEDFFESDDSYTVYVSVSSNIRVSST